ncbi:uncharacterized protein [Chelonus insularis]|uniref:uncharacterized protein n=1 Tax=Chelonus insularis TaxID=460826 RepID=UPI0015895C90|nr:uncharacterized protein LOC118072554 [Chelonus insularis]XP_034948413.1 uncharacterized protein LOC118072554 [Chelonus insularis]
MPQGSIYWQGTERRACGPGAHWNVQVVRGKVTTRCLWHACKALGIGILLMLLGACMATIGYYADQLSVAQEIRGNMTVKVKNESRGFHLNNLSYAGPIVMGVGGFIVVAACVMTFEARDSAAKVVPARFRFNQNSTLKHTRSQRPRRSTSSQTSKWDHQLGLFRVNRTPSPGTHEISRKQLTAEFLRFSRNLHEKGVPTHPIKKSPSAPSLAIKKSPSRRKSKLTSCALLNPELLQRHALSVDNPRYSPPKVSSESLEHNKMNGSQVSMAMDLYIPNKGPVTLRVKDRSDTARRHQLLRQTKIEDVDDGEAKKMLARKQNSDSIAYPSGTLSSRLSIDYSTRKRTSIDVRLTDEYGITGLLSTSTSPRDFRKSSSPNFRHMSFDRIGDDRRLDPTAGRKASLEIRRSPDFRRADYRYLMDEMDPRLRANTFENGRKQRQKLHHSRSDDNRRRSFDKHRRDSQQASRFSLNAPVVIESYGPEYELKYFTSTSTDKDEIRSIVSDDSHVAEIKETRVSMTTITVDEHVDNALLEEPELENLNDVETCQNNNETGETETVIKESEENEKESKETVLDVEN